MARHKSCKQFKMKLYGSTYGSSAITVYEKNRHIEWHLKNRFWGIVWEMDRKKRWSSHPKWALIHSFGWWLSMKTSCRLFFEDYLNIFCCFSTVQHITCSWQWCLRMWIVFYFSGSRIFFGISFCFRGILRNSTPLPPSFTPLPPSFVSGRVWRALPPTCRDDFPHRLCHREVLHIQELMHGIRRLQ
jgi:hypothetical protein